MGMQEAAMANIESTTNISKAQYTIEAVQMCFVYCFWLRSLLAGWLLEFALLSGDIPWVFSIHPIPTEIFVEMGITGKLYAFV